MKESYNPEEQEEYLTPAQRIEKDLEAVQKKIKDAGGWLYADQDLVRKEGELLNELDQLERDQRQ